jgi:predicted ATP-binding protein involved in virulence
LHPEWQGSALDNLLSAFPKIQFVVATHSPFLLQVALEQGWVLDSATGERKYADDTSLEDIVETVMSVAQLQRSRRFLEMKERAQAYLELLETPRPTEEAKAELKRKLDDALAVFANDPASAAWLEQRRISKGL